MFILPGLKSSLPFNVRGIFKFFHLVVYTSYEIIHCNKYFLFAIDTPADLFFQTCFNYINEKRARAGVQPLKWRNDLADQAQRWAQYLADTNSLKKDPKAKKYNEGETLSWSKPAKDKCEEEEDDMCYSCRQAIDTWYKNRKWHSHKRSRKIKDAYSQVRILIALRHV